MTFEGWACRPRVKPSVVLAEGDCLVLAAALVDGPEPERAVVEAAARAFETGGLEAVEALERSVAARALATALGGMVAVSFCPEGPPTPVARVYSPGVTVPLNGVGYVGDRGVIEALTLTVRGFSPWPSMKPRAGLAPLGIECLPPYARGEG